jgi:deoxyribonuclease (pyrimidine dimer)
MNPDPARVFKRWQWPDELYKSYTPDQEALDIIRERIEYRISEKPGWYRFSPYI